MSDDAPNPCDEFRPDHNGECLTCDEWYDAHTPEAVARGEEMMRRLVMAYNALTPELRRAHLDLMEAAAARLTPKDHS